MYLLRYSMLAHPSNCKTPYCLLAGLHTVLAYSVNRGHHATVLRNILLHCVHFISLRQTAQTILALGLQEHPAPSLPQRCT